MLSVKRILVDRVDNKLDFHIHQTEKEKRIFHHVAGGRKIALVQTTDLVRPRFGIINITQNHVGKLGPIKSLFDFGVHVENDGDTRFCNLSKIVHSPTVRFVGFFAIYVDKTRHIGK